MTVYRVALRSFEAVEEHYCAVKPIRGTDIRPMGKRTRKYERIVKVSDDHYDIMGDNYNDEKTPTVSWVRLGGDTYVNIYNHGSTSSYRFLERVIPQGLHFAMSQSGKHRISWVEKPPMNVGHSGEAYIPEVRNWAYKYRGNRSPVLNSGKRPHLRFIRDGEHWRQVATKYHPPRTRIRKETKQPYRKAIAKFYDDLLVMIPMLRDNFTREGVGASNSTLQGGKGHIYLAHSASLGHMFRRVILDEEHELRADLMIAIIGSLEATSLHLCDGEGKNVPVWKRTTLRSTYNNWINDRLHFTETVFEQEEIPNE